MGLIILLTHLYYTHHCAEPQINDFDGVLYNYFLIRPRFPPHLSLM